MTRALYFSALILIGFAIMTPQCKAQGHIVVDPEAPETVDTANFDWNSQYQPMTFDLVHRGSFNTSMCNAEMMNCWEIISPTEVCTVKEGVTRNFGSMCSVMREYCRDFQDDVDVETTGAWCKEAKAFGKDLGKRLKEASGDPRAESYLVQHIALAIQRGNAASVMGTFPPAAVLA